MKKILIVLFSWVAAVSMSNAQIVINEVCAANGDVKYDPVYYNFSPWIELYNAGNSSVNLNGYYLSDDPATPNKYQINAVTIPAKGYVLFWCDDVNNGFHTNFSLDSEGEVIILTNSASQVIDQVEFPRQYTNVSYGRISNGPTLGYLVNPSPSALNNASTGTEVLSKPSFSVAAGRYSGTQTVALSHALSQVEVRYTLDGSEPHATSLLYQNPINISATKILKVKAYKSGYLPSETAVATYFINEHAFSLPVISLSTKNDYLNSNLIGIYTDGTNGLQLNCSNEPKNWNQNWDRHAVIEYFEANGQKKFDQHIDIRIGGACSRNFPQKSLVVKARDKYGSKTIEQKLFPNKESQSYGGFILRNSGNDFNVTMFRDAVEHAIVSDQMDIDYLDYQPTIVYLNGQYWGIQNMREKIDADYIEANYGIEKDDIDLIETYENALEGTSDKYINYKNTLAAMDRSTQAAYDYISANIDVQEYINYLVTEIYYGNTDWPGNNIKFWRQRSTDGKFRWILWDMDFGFSLYENLAPITHPTLNFATAIDGPGWPNPPWSTVHIRLVLDNPQFREQFIRTFEAALNTTFATDRVVGILNQFQARIASEMPYHKSRWGGSTSDFNSEVQRMRNFAATRNTFMRQHLRDFFGLSDNDISLSISTTPAGAGRFSLNGITSEVSIVDARYGSGLSYTVQPVAARGYKFKSWRITKHTSDSIPIIDRGAIWKYFDQGALPGAGWVSPTFNDDTWPSGPAQLGYGDGDEQTTTSFGPDTNNKYITTYFRKSFTISDTVGLYNVAAEALFDDGIVVYLNGIEVFRSNMPSGTVDNTTVAAGNVALENSFSSFSIPKQMLNPGINVLAVEIHQSGPASSDVSFDFSMRSVILGNVEQSTTTIPVVIDNAFSDVILEAAFEVDTRVITNVVINEISARPSSHLDGNNEAEDWFEIRNNGTQPVNLAGLYLTDNPGQKKKHLIAAETGSETMLAVGAYKIFWADDEVTEGKDHVSFKLSADGEMVGLYQELDGMITAIDEVYFTSQHEEGSFSRIPDATGPFVFTINATPTMVNELVTGLEPEAEFAVYPNPVGNSFLIKSGKRIERLRVIDGLGHVVKSFEDIDGNIAIPVAGLKPGLYLVRVLFPEGWQTIRIVKE
jgi:hypothetical protein